MFHEVDFMKQPFFDKNSAENHDFFIIQQLFHKVYFVKQGVVPEDYMEHMIDKLITLKREGEKNYEEDFAINQSDNINTGGSNNVIEYKCVDRICTTNASRYAMKVKQMVFLVSVTLLGAFAKKLLN